MSGGDVVCSGWLRKSPPEKKLRRFVSNVLILFKCTDSVVTAGLLGQDSCKFRGRFPTTAVQSLLVICRGFFRSKCWRSRNSLKTGSVPQKKWVSVWRLSVCSQHWNGCEMCIILICGVLIGCWTHLPVLGDHFFLKEHQVFFSD